MLPLLQLCLLCLTYVAGPQIPPKEELKTVVDKVKEFFGSTSDSIKESFGSITNLSFSGNDSSAEAAEEESTSKQPSSKQPSSKQ